MDIKNTKIWQICSIILGIICIALIVGIAIILQPKNISVDNKQEENITYLNEGFEIQGEIKNLKNVIYCFATILLENEKYTAYISVVNESDTKNVEATNTKVEFLNENGEVVATAEAELPEMEKGYTGAELKVEFDMPKVELIRDIRIVAEEK